MIKSLSFIFILISSLQSFSASMTGAVSSATGGTGRGTAEPIDSVLLNPAIVSQLSSKILAVNYTKDRWGVTLADNGREALFPAALAYVKSENDFIKTQQVSLVLSYMVAKNISIGTNISLMEYDQQNIPNSEKYRQTTGDIGIAYSTNTFGAGIVANKVFSTSIDLSDLLQVQKTIGVGVNYTYLNFFRFRADLESAPDNQVDRLVYMGGLETFTNDWVVLRLGYQNNNVAKKNFITAGLGFAGPQFGLHYGYISNVADSKDNKHSIDLGVPF